MRTRKTITIMLILILALMVSGCGQGVCRHTSWTGGVCDGCGAVCRHAEFENGVCSVCGVTCTEHEYDTRGICVRCGYECGHVFDNSVCAVCGFVCDHARQTEKDDTCPVCGGNCGHPSHNTGGICSVCGGMVRHRYRNGKCVVCRKEIPFETDLLDFSIWDYHAEQGTIEDNIYATHNYASGTDISGEYTGIYKHMTVYTPYGYDKDGKYNVIFLLAGTDMDERYFWMPQAYGDNDGVELRCMMDNLIREGVIDPVIIVEINYFSNGDMALDDGADSFQLRMEMINDIMPYVVRNYATYASGTSEAELTAQREHFGFIGASYGAINMFAAFPELFRVCSWFGGISGGCASAEYIAGRIDNLPYPLDYLYMCAGDADHMYDITLQEYSDLDKYSDQCIGGENIVFQTILGAGHEPKVWCNGIYNCLLAFFG